MPGFLTASDFIALLLRAVYAGDCPTRGLLLLVRGVFKQLKCLLGSLQGIPGLFEGSPIS